MKLKTVIIIIAIVTLLIWLIGCQPETANQPPTGNTTSTVVIPPTTIPNITTTTTQNTSCSIGPSGQDDTQKLIATTSTCSTLDITGQLVINGEVKISKSNLTINFKPNAKLIRTKTAPDYSGLSILFFDQSSNITINNLQIEGPNTPKVYSQGGRAVCGFFQPLYNQHGLKITNSNNITINGGLIKNINGDGIYLDRGADNVTLNNVNVNCVGRTALTNLGSIHTRVYGGRFEEAVWWIFNVELEGRNVTDYVLTHPYIGWSRLNYMIAQCPYGGKFDITINQPIFSTEAYQPYSGDRTCGSVIIK